MCLHRTQLGLSQTELGQRLGVTYQQIQKYASGVNGSAASRLWQMAGAFDMPDSFVSDGVPVAMPTLSLRSTDSVKAGHTMGNVQEPSATAGPPPPAVPASVERMAPMEARPHSALPQHPPHQR